jgi:GH24 family phage-related lysozyme (muramidase)
MLADPSEEGRRNDVYVDSVGHPTVGIGHKVRPEDDLRVGQRISDAQVDAFFRQDGGFALKKAREQAGEAGIDDPAFVRRLGAMTFQLGAHKWPSKFPKTWSLIRSGDYVGSANELYNSDWARQTPRRADAFRDDLLKLPPKRTP